VAATVASVSGAASYLLEQNFSADRQMSKVRSSGGLAFASEFFAATVYDELGGC